MDGLKEIPVKLIMDSFISGLIMAGADVEEVFIALESLLDKKEIMKEIAPAVSVMLDGINKGKALDMLNRLVTPDGALQPDPEELRRQRLEEWEKKNG